MELVGGDAYLRAHAEFTTVGKARGDVVVDSSRVDIAQELGRTGFVVRHDAVGMVRGIGVDEVDRGAVVGDLRDIDVERKILCPRLVLV